MYHDAGTGQHAGRLLSELIGPVPGVAPDRDPGLGGGGIDVEQPAGQGGRRAADHGPVHPVRPGTDGAAQAGGAELQPRSEPVS